MGYSGRYPNGKFAGIAKVKIRQLKRNYKPVEVADGSLQTEEIGDGAIDISSQPSGAKIYVNNSYQSTSPIYLQLKPGKHTIKADKEGYKPESSTVRILSSQQTPVSFVLGYLDYFNTLK
jgi:PEGA domain